VNQPEIRNDSNPISFSSLAKWKIGYNFTPLVKGEKQDLVWVIG